MEASVADRAYSTSVVAYMPACTTKEIVSARRMASGTQTASTLDARMVNDREHTR